MLTGIHLYSIRTSLIVLRFLNPSFGFVMLTLMYLDIEWKIILRNK